MHHPRDNSRHVSVSIAPHVIHCNTVQKTKHDMLHENVSLAPHMQHTKTHCNTQQTHCNTFRLQHTSTHALSKRQFATCFLKHLSCGTCQHTATHCKHTATNCFCLAAHSTHCNTRDTMDKLVLWLPLAPHATHCITLQHTATTLQHNVSVSLLHLMQHTATYCNTLQAHCNPLFPSLLRLMQRTATHCNTLQTRCNTLFLSLSCASCNCIVHHHLSHHPRMEKSHSDCHELTECWIWSIE